MVNNKSIFYTKSFLKFISFFSLFAVFLLVTRTSLRIYDLVKNPTEFSTWPLPLLYKYYFIIIENICFIGFFIFLFFKPQRFLIIGIVTLFYAFDNLFTNGQIPFIGIPMFSLCVVTFAIRGFFLTRRKLKISIFVAFYILSLFVPAFYDKEFFEHFIVKIAISTVTFATLFFASEYAKQNGSKQATKEKILNLAAFKGLDRSDMYLLQDVLENKKYKEIAQKIHGSEGALRNKLSRIYKILEVGDRTGFLTIYSGYELIYEPEEIAVNN